MFERDRRHRIDGDQDLETVRLDNSTDVSVSTVDLLQSYGVNLSEMYHIMARPADYISVVLNNPYLWPVLPRSVCLQRILRSLPGRTVQDRREQTGIAVP